MKPFMILDKPYKGEAEKIVLINPVLVPVGDVVVSTRETGRKQSSISVIANGIVYSQVMELFVEGLVVKNIIVTARHGSLNRYSDPNKKEVSVTAFLRYQNHCGPAFYGVELEDQSFITKQFEQFVHSVDEGKFDIEKIKNEDCEKLFELFGKYRLRPEDFREMMSMLNGMKDTEFTKTKWFHRLRNYNDKDFDSILNTYAMMEVHRK